MDWDIFYSTGELVKTKECSGNAANVDMQNCCLEMIATQNKEGWKKRLLPILISVCLKNILSVTCT